MILFLQAFLISFFVRAETFTIDPYLYTVAGKQLAVSWVPSAQGGNKAQLFLNKSLQNNLNVQVDEFDIHTAFLPLSGCNFGEGYTYQVDGMDTPARIRNIPCLSSDKSIRVSFIADTQEGPDIAAQFARSIEGFNPQFYIHAGDLVQTGSDWQAWVDFFHAMAPLSRSRVLVPAIGNHEYRGNNLLWQKFFQTPAAQSYYDLMLGGLHVIVLNSCFEDEKVSHLDQLAWFEQALAVPAQWKVVVFHHPPFSKGFAHSIFAYRMEHVILQEMYVPLMEKAGVDLVLNGHTHLFERSTKNGIEYVTAGAAGGKMGLFGGTSDYTWKSLAIRTVTNIEITTNQLIADSLTLEDELVDRVLLKK